MQKSTSGKSGLEVSALGLGCMGKAAEEKSWREMIMDGKMNESESGTDVVFLGFLQPLTFGVKLNGQAMTYKGGPYDYSAGKR